MKEQDLNVFRQLLKCDDVMIVVHRNPDGDALGSAFALLHLLKQRGKRAWVVSHDRIDRNLRFLAEGEEELLSSSLPGTIVSVDVATRELFGSSLSYYADFVDYNIDHHYTNPEYAKYNIVYPDYSSTGEVLFGLIDGCGIALDRYLAEHLYGAISFDTGCFRYSNTTAQTHRVAARLLECGINASEINRKLFDIVSLTQLKMENEALHAVKQYHNGHITLLAISQQMLRDCGATEEDVAGMVSMIRRIEGTIVGATLKEMPDGNIRVSLRACDDLFDVSAVAAIFGGGGHVKAAGCLMKCSLKDAEKNLLSAIEAQWRETYAPDHVFE